MASTKVGVIMTNWDCLSEMLCEWYQGKAIILIGDDTTTLLDYVQEGY